MDSKSAAKILSCDEEDTECFTKWKILVRMNCDSEFQKEVRNLYNPPFYIV